MRYYISKPATHKIDTSLIEGIKRMDPEAAFVKSLPEADICILQNGWTRSRICIADYHSARDEHIETREAYLYTDKFKVKTT